MAALQLDGGKAHGVILADGTAIDARAVILCTGTFLGGKLFRGEEVLTGGRIGEDSATKLADQVRGFGLPMARLKTGTLSTGPLCPSSHRMGKGGRCPT